jgi:hypothetical protein
MVTEFREIMRQRKRVHSLAAAMVSYKTLLQAGGLRVVILHLS